MRTKAQILEENNMNYPEFNMRCELSFKFFVEKMIGINTCGGINPFQQEWVDAIKKHRFLVIEAATGHSKSTVIGHWYALWLCWKKKNQEIIVLSQSATQAEKILRAIRNIISDNELLKDYMGTERTARVWNQRMIHTKEGNNTIRVVAYESVRGERAHFIYADEVDAWENTEVYFEDVVSRLHPGGHIALTSTPKNNTNLLYQIRERDISKKYHWMKTPAITRRDGTHFDPRTFCEEDLDDAIPTWPGNFSMEEIRDKWATQGKFKFISQQLVTILGETENAPFSIKNIYACYDQKLAFSFSVNPDAIYFVGADFASSEGQKADYTAYVVLEYLNGVITLKYIKTLPKGTKKPVRIEELNNLFMKFNKYGACRVCADATNIGVDIVPELRMRGMSVIEKQFQWRLRREMIHTCGNIIQNGGEYVRIPKKNGPEYINEQNLIDELQKQLAGFLLVKSDAGNENYKSKAPHDDIAISFMMALIEASKMLISSVKPIIHKAGQIQEGNDLQRLVKITKDNNLQKDTFMENPPYNPSIQPNVNSLVRINPKTRGYIKV